MVRSDGGRNVSGFRNPLIWIAFIVAGLIGLVLTDGERGPGNALPEAGLSFPESGSASKSVASADQSRGVVERGDVMVPGMRARQYIAQIREGGRPYPLHAVQGEAEAFMLEGSLADAHLIYFFAARENHLPAIMKMAEMSDPTLFRAENSLLDDADMIQAHKWYQKAVELDHAIAAARIEGLRQWAAARADTGDRRAERFLLGMESGGSQ